MLSALCQLLLRVLHRMQHKGPLIHHVSTVAAMVDNVIIDTTATPLPGIQCRMSKFSLLQSHRFSNKLCGRPPQYAPALQVELESGVRVACDVGYLCANFSLSRPLFST